LRLELQRLHATCGVLKRCVLLAFFMFCMAVQVVKH
jgi:hypothetical protein